MLNANWLPEGFTMLKDPDSEGLLLAQSGFIIAEFSRYSGWTYIDDPYIEPEECSAVSKERTEVITGGIMPDLSRVSRIV